MYIYIWDGTDHTKRKVIFYQLCAFVCMRSRKRPEKIKYHERTNPASSSSSQPHACLAPCSNQPTYLQHAPDHTRSPAQVRAFKGEIDALTTRSRFAEGAFLALYKLLREAPDPAVTVQALEKAARAAVEALEGRNRYK